MEKGNHFLSTGFFPAEIMGEREFIILIKICAVLQVRAKVFLAKLESEEGSSNRL